MTKTLIERQPLYSQNGNTFLTSRYRAHPLIERIDATIATLDRVATGNTLQNGEVTLALIKPRLDEALSSNGHLLLDTTPELPDHQLTEKLINHTFSPNLGLFPFAIFSLIFDYPLLQDFYRGGAQRRQLRKPPINSSRYDVEHPNRWHEWAYTMLHWPTTVLLLEGNDAVETWRKNVGAEWRLKMLKTPKYHGTLRSIFQGTEHNTVFHSSDSQKSLIREIGLLRDFFVEQKNLLLRSTKT